MSVKTLLRKKRGPFGDGARFAWYSEQHLLRFIKKCKRDGDHSALCELLSHRPDLARHL